MRADLQQLFLLRLLLDLLLMPVEEYRQILTLYCLSQAECCQMLVEYSLRLEVFGYATLGGEEVYEVLKLSSEEQLCSLTVLC